MRTHVKKVRYAQHVRDMVLDGKVNDAQSGQWVGEASAPSPAAFRNSLEGCRGGGGRSKRFGKKQAQQPAA